MEILARTWNKNESGILWDSDWFLDEEGYGSICFTSGVFNVKPRRFEDQESFWAEWELESKRFFGKRLQ